MTIFQHFFFLCNNHKHRNNTRQLVIHLLIHNLQVLQRSDQGGHSDFCLRGGDEDCQRGLHQETTVPEDAGKVEPPPDPGLLNGQAARLWPEFYQKLPQREFCGWRCCAAGLYVGRLFSIVWYCCNLQNIMNIYYFLLLLLIQNHSHNILRFCFDSLRRQSWPHRWTAWQVWWFLRQFWTAHWESSTRAVGPSWQWRSTFGKWVLMRDWKNWKEMIALNMPKYLLGLSADDYW